MGRRSPLWWRTWAPQRRSERCRCSALPPGKPRPACAHRLGPPAACRQHCHGAAPLKSGVPALPPAAGATTRRTGAAALAGTCTTSSPA